MSLINFFVDGDPVPKQSFRYSKAGGGYTPENVKAWQERVAFSAWTAMFNREPITGPVSVRLVFHLKDRRRKDLDNLAKGVMDGMNKIVFRDDSQVVVAHVEKRYNADQIAGVSIEIEEL